MRRVWAISFVWVCFGLLACQSDPFPTADEMDTLQALPRLDRPAADPSNRYADDPGALALGERLFDDAHLSGCGTVSCSSCHPAPAYTVSTPLAKGCGGDTARSPPTLLNVAFGEWFMWDGRKDSLWGQPSGPILNPVEMAATPDSVQQYMQSAYATDYQSVFGVEPASESSGQKVVANVGKALEAYMRTLIRVKAPFDDQVQHFIDSANAGTAEQDPFYLPLKTFVRTARCSICHKGPQLSDGLFHNIGLDNHGTMDRGRALGIDQVLADPYNGAGAYSDDPLDGKRRIDSLQSLTRDGTEGAFKTPTLRNVQLTAPYMHNGSLATLDDVIDFYDRGGDPANTFDGPRTETITPLHLSSDEKAALKTLLGSLTGSENP